MIEKLKARWHAEETAIGNFIKNWIGKLFALCGLIGLASEQLKLIPDDYIPVWVKSTIAVCSVIGFVAGKMTKK